MLRVVTGPARSGKTYWVLEKIAQRCRNREKSILIVPESYSHHGERMLLTRCGNAGGRYAQVMTFSKLVRDILEYEGLRDRSLDSGGRVLLMTRAFLAVRSALTYYRGTLHPRMIDQLLEAADELIACKVPPAELVQAVEEEGRGKLFDLGLIYTAYTALLEERMEADPLDRATACIPTSDLFKATEVFIDGFSGFTAQRYAAIDAFLGRAAVTVTLLMDGESMAFTQQQVTLGRLKRMGEARGKLEVVALPSPSTPLLELARGLFDYRQTEAEAEGLTLAEAADPMEECQWVAAKIRQLTLTGQVRMREIALVCSDLEGYTNGLVAAFERYRLPLFLSRPQDILKKPPVIAAIGGLEALEDSLSQERVFAFLKLGLCGLSAQSLSMLEQYVTQWDIGGSRWQTPFTWPTTGFGDEREGEEQRLSAVNEARRIAVGYWSGLQSDLRSAGTGAEYVAALRRHFADTGLEERLEERVAQLAGRGEARLASEYAQLYDIINTALEQYEAVCGDAAQTLAEFCGLLRLTLSQYSVDTIPVSLDAIQACDFERLETQGVRHVFILGAREGLMPKAATGSGLITEPDRVRLETHGIALTQSAEERAFEIQSYIYRAFAGGEQTVTVSWPRMTAGGEECSPSYLIARLSDLAPGLIPRQADQELETLSLTAPIPAFERACMSLRSQPSATGRAALEYFAPRRGEFFHRLSRYATAPRGPIGDRRLIRALYGDRLSMTASRLEKVAGCRFSYFMQYGMRAKPFRRAQFGAPEAGTFIHEIVEKSVRELCHTGRQDVAAVVEEHAAVYAARRFGGREYGARFRAIFRKLVKNAIYIVQNIYDEIQAGDFKPLYFEMDIGGQVPPLTLRQEDYILTVTGKVDRVDGYVKDGRLYIKVVDYKTGSKSFRLSDVLYGLNVQMFLYLLMAGHGLAAEGQPVESAGALYVPAKAPYVAAEAGEDAEAVQARLDKELRRVGLVLSDLEILEAMERGREGGFRFLPVKINRDGTASADSAVASAAQMGKLLARTQKHLEQLGGLLMAGDVEANPYRKGRDFTACQWCDYRAACHFDENMEKDKLRYLPPLKNSEVFALLEQEGEDEHGG